MKRQLTMRGIPCSVVPDAASLVHKLLWGIWTQSAREVTLPYRTLAFCQAWFGVAKNS